MSRTPVEPRTAPERDRVVLEALARDTCEDYFLPFRVITRRTGFAPDVVRRDVRRLARKGYTAYARGLWTEDGYPAGAGYAITPAGRQALAEAERDLEERALRSVGVLS
jgi:DNA-binding Lrp family transcriptional regulator